MDPNSNKPNQTKVVIKRHFVNKYLFSATLELEAENEKAALVAISKLIYNNSNNRVDMEIRMSPDSIYKIRKSGSIEYLDREEQK